MAERNTTQEKAHYNNVLQESNVSNLLTLTSDSLPDIFRKPISQQQHEVPLNLQSKFGNSEDKVSKLGYCPSSTNTQQGFGTKINHRESQKESSIKLVTEGLGIVTQVKEEVPCADILKPAVPQIPLPGAKNEFVAWNQPEKSSFSTNKLPSVHSEMEEIYAFTNAKNKSGLNSTSDTASALGLPTQPTVKMHPLDQAQTPLAKNLTWTGHSSFSTTKIRESSLVSFASTSKTEMHNNEQKPSLGILLPKVQAETSPIFNLASSKPPQPIPIQPVVSVVAEVQPIDPIQHHVEQQSKLIPPVSSSNILPPPNARPTPKTKQIAVNGKVYSVMKPLGRGGSSVVYQVELEILRNSFFTHLFIDF
jgi:serine/threonine-protein kinase TTK/MPS1